MVRRYEEPIEVRCEPADEPVVPPAPSAFLWRGRRYVVRGVLGHWRERRAWWREALDPVEHAAEQAEGAARHTGRQLVGPDADGVTGPQPVPGSPASLEQEVWRVLASPGRLPSTGVYDLGRDAGWAPEWRMLRVAD